MPPISQPRVVEKSREMLGSVALAASRRLGGQVEQEGGAVVGGRSIASKQTTSDEE